ncbi:hypothetical protein LCGC14_0752270 [marine sediment metagenome]|uniref:Uncharacterized protein n=1 Tax=marine sediment metagenome TaxID=412755 RepID=A0A0F9QND6_9ZZZZ
MIKTNKRRRDLYTKHLNKLYDYADRTFNDWTCYLCDASSSQASYRNCDNCPLPGDINSCDTSMRKKNLRTVDGSQTRSYNHATSISIRKHARWIEKQIVKNTDCEFYWK